MYCVFLGKAVQTVNPPSGSVGASQIADSSIALGKLSATGTKDSTTFLRGDNTFAVAGGDNTPAWKAENSASNQSLSHDSTTKLTFTSEIFDTDNAYDAANSKFTVPTGEGGKYLIRVSYEMAVQTNPTYAYIYVNGSAADCSRFKMSSYSNKTELILTLSAGDYVEGYTYQASGGAVDILGKSGARGSVFEGFKLIGI
jgi:hypothetical protein